MIFDSDVMIWAFRGNKDALNEIDHADCSAISSVTYMELLQGVRNKYEMRGDENSSQAFILDLAGHREYL